MTAENEANHPAPVAPIVEKPAWERDPSAPAWVDADDDPLAIALRTALPEAILAARSFAGDLVLDVLRERLADVARELKTAHGFSLIVDLCGADYPDREPRFDVVVHLASLPPAQPYRVVRLKVQTDEGTPVPTLTGVYRGANWPERETFDMYGVRFEGHPDMTRILLWEGFNGHPLRKEFPVEGIDTGAAIYPEHYGETMGPIAGTGTGWKAPQPAPAKAEPEPEVESASASEHTLEPEKSPAALDPKENAGE